MNNKNKKLIALALGIVVVFGGVYLFSRNSDEERVEAQTYSSRDHDFTFPVPKGYSYIEAKDPTSGRESIIVSRTKDKDVPEAGEGPTAVSVDVFTKPSSLDPQAWVRSNNVSNFNLAVGDMGETSVDGVEALAYEWDGLYRGRSVVFEYNGNIILISGTYLETSDPIYKYFDEVVSSFELE